MKLSELDKSEYQITDEPIQGSLGGGMRSSIPGVTPFARMGATFGAEIGKAGLGLGELAVKGLKYGASKISPSLAKGFDPQISAIKDVKENVFNKPFEKERGTLSGKVGQGLGVIAPFVAGTPAITRSQNILANILQPISKTRGLGTITKAVSQAIPEAVGSGATQLAVSGGDMESTKDATLYSGLGSGALSTLGSLGRATFFPELKTSVTRALGIQGKTTGGMVEPIIEKKIAGLSVLNKYAPDIKVKDADGFEKAFVPSKATFDETLQAWNTARKAIFKKYHEISTNLGKSDFVSKDGQVVPTGIDVSQVATDLNNIINSPRTSPYKEAARSILKDLVDNFGEVRNGNVVFKKVTPDTIETFLSDLYVPASSVFQGKGDKAYAEIAAGASKGVRNLLDEAIESAGGTEYSGLRSEYSALKAIEEDLVRRFQQEARQLGGGLSDYANIFNTGDIIAGLISQNPQFIAKGVGQGVLTSLFKALKRPNRYLQRSFQLLEKSDGGDLSSRMFGGVGGRVLTEQDQKIADTIKNYVKNPKLGMSIEDVSKNAYKGETDLTTKVLKKLEGRTTVSKQFISDLTNSPDLKQPERDLIRNVLNDQPDTVSVPDFANKVKSELLPLKTVKDAEPYFSKRGQSGRYENITLPDELRGPVANYSEHIYESPIKTSAGGVHFGGYKNGTPENYFAHTRREDLPPSTKGLTDPDHIQKVLDEEKGTTRRVIEIQSDLFQKGRLEGEGYMPSSRAKAREAIPKIEAALADPNYDFKNFGVKELGLGNGIEKSRKSVEDYLQWYKNELKNMDEGAVARDAEMAKLEPYRNTWHERVIREEVKQAAIDGKTKLQFPTGETAMKIEGLGDNTQWLNPLKEDLPRIEVDDLSIGKEIRAGADGDDWIITDVLGDGKFKAVPDDNQNFISEELADLGINGPDDFTKALQNRNPDVLELIKGSEETFDISGKVDTTNAQYVRYEKTFGKFLQNKYGAKKITDAQGVKWWEVNVSKDMKKFPIEAFGVAGLLGIDKEND